MRNCHCRPRYRFHGGVSQARCGGGAARAETALAGRCPAGAGGGHPALAEHRAKQGFETVVSTESLDKALAGLPRKPSFILLVGDDEGGQEAQKLGSCRPSG